MARGAESATKMSFTTKSYVCGVAPCTSPNFPIAVEVAAVDPVKVVELEKLVCDAEHYPMPVASQPR